jgi:4-hydroxythreonine-4-phosphate dehydrogenase
MKSQQPGPRPSQRPSRAPSAKPKQSRGPLAISVGDPAGVGPQIALAAAVDAACSGQSLVVYGDATRLALAMEAHAASGVRVVRVAAEGPYTLRTGTVALADAGPVSDACVALHGPSAEGGAAQLRALDLAAAAVREGHARALITGPTSKEAATLSGAAFMGQTEHLARLCGLRDDAVTMMFLGPTLRLALVTTHVSVARVAHEITEARVARAVTHLGEALLQLRTANSKAAPTVVVAALNPHAGEHGMFGDEDGRVIAPGAELAAAQPPFADGRVRFLGVRPAETALRQAALGKVDGVVCMMHDQATIPSKLLDWGKAVNVTWGLPFLRASVDHGVAYDAAARGDADPAGMLAAVALAVRLTRG